MVFELTYKPVLRRRNKSLVKELSTPPPGAKDLYFTTQYSQSSWGQFKSCLWKQWWTYWRSPDYNLVRYFFTLACALMLGTIFWKVGTKRFVSISNPFFKTISTIYLLSNISKQSAKSHVCVYILLVCLIIRDSSTDLTMIIGAMYASVLFVGINNCSTVQPIVAVERTVFYRERAAGMYSALPYALAQVISPTKINHEIVLILQVLKH